MSKFDLLSRGLQIIDPGDFSSLQSSSGTAALVTSGFPSGGPTKAVSVCYPSSGMAYGQLMYATSPYLECPYTQADLTGALVEVYNPNDYPIPFFVELLDAAGTSINWFRAMAEVSPGWQLVFLPAVFDLKKLLTEEKSIRYVRYSYIADPGDNWPHTVGAALHFGRVYLNPTQRPVFLLSTDDGVLHTITPPASTNGFPASGNTYKAICDHYGFRATAYVIGKILDNPTTYPGYMTTAQVLALQDAGWSIANHSYTHPVNGAGGGLRMLGPFGFATSYAGAANDDTAIYDDIMFAAEQMRAKGLRGWQHFGLPEGGWDKYVRTACLRAGLVSIRATSTTNVVPIRGANYAAYPLYGSFWLSGFIELFGALELDNGTLTTENIDTYIDELIRVGGTGMSYSHFLNAVGTAINFDHLCNRLKVEQDAGNLRVMTIEEYYDQQYDFGGRTFFDGTLTPPVALTESAVADVGRVIAYTGTLSTSNIEKLTGNKIGNFNLLSTDEDKYVQIDI